MTALLLCQLIWSDNVDASIDGDVLDPFVPKPQPVSPIACDLPSMRGGYDQL